MPITCFCVAEQMRSTSKATNVVWETKVEECRCKELQWFSCSLNAQVSAGRWGKGELQWVSWALLAFEWTKNFKMCGLHRLQQKAVFIRSKNQMFNELYYTLCVNWLLNRFQIVIMTVILLEFSWLCCWIKSQFRKLTK